MSIQLAAKHLAAHGRGPDTTLVHMTPGEVASLQALAQQHGGSLTINPHTGLPEAGFLSALLPMAAGAGLAAMGVPAGYAALAVGATSAATNGGDLKKGMMAGISAYGGAGMAGAFMNAGAAAPATVLETPAGATSPYALTGASAATPSTAGSSLGSLSSFTNKPEYLSLANAAPAEAAQAAAAATPAAQAAQQAAALDSMSMGQRFDALKAGASGTNALNYIKANPLTSLGVGLAAMTPDENKTPQKATDTDRGPRANMRYYPGYGTPLPKPNMQGIEQTYNRPYYAAEGGLMGLAEGGSAEENKTYDNVEMSLAMRQLLAQQDRSLREIQRLKAQQAGTPPAQLDQKQLFADYLQRVSGGTGTGAGVGMGTGAGIGAIPWQNTQTNAKIDLPFLETPVASNTQSGNGGGGGGGGYGSSPEGRAEREARFEKMKPEEIEAHRATNEAIGKTIDFGAKLVTPLGFLKDLFAPKDKSFFADIPGNEGLVKTVNDFKGDFYTPPLSGLEAGRTARPKPTPVETPPPAPPAPVEAAPPAPEAAPPAPDAEAQQAQAEREQAARDSLRAFEAQQAAQQAQAEREQTARESLRAFEAQQAQDGRRDGSGAFPGGGGAPPSGSRDAAPSSGYGGYSDSNAKSDRTGGFNNARGGYLQNGQFDQRMARGGNVRGNLRPPQPFFQNGKFTTHPAKMYADGGELNPYDLGSYSDGGRLLKGPGDGVSDSIPATIGKGRPARLADGEFVIPARIVSEIGNGSTEAGARKLYAMMDRIQAGRKKSVGKGKVAVNSRADKYLPA